jgi:hypothetical protein
MKRMVTAALFLACASVAHANVTRIEILQTVPVAAPQGADAIGPFERITGKIHGELPTIPGTPSSPTSSSRGAMRTAKSSTSRPSRS